MILQSVLCTRGGSYKKEMKMRFARTEMAGSIVVMAALLASSPIAAKDVVATSQVLSPLIALSPAYEGMTGDALFQKLLESNQAREAQLRQYSSIRTYAVANDTGKVYAQETVRLDFQAPDHKIFRTISEDGSRLVRDLVLKRLIESESEASSGRAHRDSSIRPANYEFHLLGEQDVGPYHCLVAQVTPRRRDKYLFEGRVWIDTQDYAVVRIVGQPAKSLSFWITRADFVRQYERIGQFWLAAGDETTVHVRLYGNKILSISYQDYVINQDNDSRTAQMDQTGPMGNGRPAVAYQQRQEALK